MNRPEGDKATALVRIRASLLKDSKRAALDVDMLLVDWLSEAVAEKLERAGWRALKRKAAPLW